MFFELGGLPFGFACIGLPIGNPVSGASVSILVPLRDDTLARCFGDGDLTTGIGERPGYDGSVIGLAGTGTFTQSDDEPALPNPGKGGASANFCCSCCCCLGGV